jgi:5'-nucleotidase
LENKRLILISNDDGVEAKGLKCLIKAAREFGEVVVAAPAEAMSGMSHAITIKTPLRVKKLVQEEGLTVYACQGTPVDCVKMAVNQLLDQKPDIVLSGINHGSNASSSVVYSGTMAVAMEGTINDIPSVGFSLLDYDSDADFQASGKIVSKILKNIIDNGLEKGICLNVNIPAIPYEDIKGIKVCRQARGYWKEEFDKRIDPHKGEYYWLTGTFFNQEEEASDTDEFALKQGYVSVVPVSMDMTAYKSMDKLREWNLNSL